ncbi:MAG: homoserine O-succinyltransferase [Flammeovirgaceae bacterium]|nr:homoserine O-succinyltransferase [Flammeovirgaceae bacterium]MDW8287805.1 amidotransferase [Flammeovirgaceae bacterium]
MRVHYLQHVPFEGLGNIEAWIKEKNYALSATHFYQHDELPNLDELDTLIIMGGPMGAYDEDKIVWLKKEKKFIQQAIERGKKVLGICLGAQLIAEVLGARVYPHKHKEIGWFPVSLTHEGQSHPFLRNVPTDFTVFHWHGDTFDMPPNAVHLAKSQATFHQAFAYGKNVLGLQFHLEMNEALIQSMLVDSEEELKKAPFVQTTDEIRNNQTYFASNKKLLWTILENFIP